MSICFFSNSEQIWHLCYHAFLLAIRLRVLHVSAPYVTGNLPSLCIFISLDSSASVLLIFLHLLPQYYLRLFIPSYMRSFSFIVIWRLLSFLAFLLVQTAFWTEGCICLFLFQYCCHWPSFTDVTIHIPLCVPYRRACISFHTFGSARVAIHVTFPY